MKRRIAYRKAAKAFREIPGEVLRYVRRAYPDFVTSRSPPPLREEVPVFMFHTVTEPVFGRQMEFLRQNGYRTLSMDEFCGLVRGDLRVRQPSVVLTFDVTEDDDLKQQPHDGHGKKARRHAQYPAAGHFLNREADVCAQQIE